MNAAPSLASIVFLKIQDFARKSVSEQTRLKAQLEAVIAVTTASLAAEKRIVLDASDGAAIVILGDPPGALQVAERALAAAAAGLPLCLAVNHGTVRPAGNGAEAGLIGDGVAVAASIAEFASPSRVLISRSFRDALAEVSTELEASLHPAGVYTDAGLRTHELYSPDKSAALRRRRRLLAIGALAAVSLVGGGVAARLRPGRRDGDLGATLQRFSARGRDGLRAVVDKLKF